MTLALGIVACNKSRSAHGHPMGGGCTGSNPHSCELSGDTVLAEQSNTQHMQAAPIRMSISAGDEIHVKHTKDFVLEAKRLDPEPANCHWDDDKDGPFANKLPYASKNNQKEFHTGKGKDKGKYCRFELWLTEAGAAQRGDPHVALEP